MHRGCGVEVEVVVRNFLSWRSGSGIREKILGFIMHLRVLWIKTGEEQSQRSTWGSDTSGHGASTGLRGDHNRVRH